MATARSVVQVFGGSPQNDLWCEVCNTLGGFQVETFVLGSRGPQHVSTVRQCVRCDYDPSIDDRI